MTMMDGMGMMAWGLFSFLLGLIVVFMFVLAAAYAVKWVWRQQPQSVTGQQESALDILKRRYARGEISKEEFDKTKKDID